MNIKLFIICLLALSFSVKGTVIVVDPEGALLYYSEEGDGLLLKECGKDGECTILLNKDNVTALQGAEFKRIPTINAFYTKAFKTVSIKAFEVMTAEVTQRQWFQIMNDNPSAFKNKTDCDNHIRIETGFQTGVSMCPDNPVENVSWREVQVFIAKINEMEGIEGCNGTSYGAPGCYRLPTEVEWEYIARGDEKFAMYPFKDRFDEVPNFAWFYSNSDGTTHPVAQLDANGYGLHDVYGNVSEWCQENDGTRAMHIGGSYNKVASRLMYRFTEHLSVDKGDETVGFRIVRNIP